MLWKYYDQCEDSKYAKCKDCGQKVSRGGDSTKTYNTSNMGSHLKSKHDALHTQWKEKEIKPKTDRQLTLEESSDRSTVWDINDVRAHRVHCRIVEMIALDDQPLSIVEDRGFNRLISTLEPRYSMPSRRYMSDTTLPRIKEGILSEVKKQLDVHWVIG